MHQLKALIEEDFPSEVKEHLLYLYLEELSADLAQAATSQEDSKETSIGL